MSYPSYWCCFYKTSNLKHEKRPYVWLKGQSLPHSSSPLNSTAIRSAKLRIAKVKRAEDFALCIEMFLPVSGLYQPFLSNQKACFMNYSSLGDRVVTSDTGLGVDQINWVDNNIWVGVKANIERSRVQLHVFMIGHLMFGSCLQLHKKMKYWTRHLLIYRFSSQTQPGQLWVISVFICKERHWLLSCSPLIRVTPVPRDWGWGWGLAHPSQAVVCHLLICRQQGTFRWEIF